MENQPLFSALAVLLLSSSLVCTDDMEQAEESPSTAHVLGTGHGNPMVAVCGDSAGEGEKIWAATEKRELTHETSFHPLFISRPSEDLFPTFPKFFSFLPKPGMGRDMLAELWLKPQL